MTSPSSQTFTTIVTDGSWMRGLHQGHLVELVVHGRTLVGKVLGTGADIITIAVPPDEQPDDMCRSTGTGTAVVSIDGAAARVPVSTRTAGEAVRLQITGPAEIIQRRQHVRLPLSVPVRLAWQRDDRGSWSWVESSTVDISVGGLRVASTGAAWPGAGQAVQASLDLPYGRVVEQTTMIGRACGDDLRLAFAGIGPATRMMIESLVQGTAPAAVRSV